jgi:hypothetical protein
MMKATTEITAIAAIVVEGRLLEAGNRDIRRE